MPTALITGITGQDGSYLTDFLLRQGYVVHGLVRRNSSISRSRLEPLFQDKQIYEQRLFLHYADLDDATTIRRILLKTEPDEMYHLAGQSHVGLSFDIPESTCQFTAMGTLKLLEIVRDLDKKPRFLHISSSEIFGRPNQWPQVEETPMQPVNPYGIAKAFATQMVRLYRESFGCYACNAICYNHESPRRGESFVTRKISRAAAAISLGLQDKVALGSLDAKRDWGYAPEYVDAMWRMLQQPEPNDFVLATGETNQVQDFLEAAFTTVNLDWRDHVEQDPRYNRPSDVRHLVGDSNKALTKLDWRAKTRLPELASIMVQSDLELMRGANPAEPAPDKRMQ
ncbi:MAG: GDP-mannose 4,6-dehydratase [Rubripirellula sp.]|nr:GDP-mannose 4,6-dehydratase [Rubripirellula sp.]